MNKVTMEFLAQAHFLSDLQLSPQGGTAAFLQCQCRDEGYAKSLYLAENTTIRRLTQPGVGQFLWEDEKTLLFTASGRHDAAQMRPAEQTELFRIRTDGGEARLLYRLPLQIETMLKQDDDHLLVVAQVGVDCPDYALLSDCQREEVNRRRQQQQTVQVLNETPFVLDGSGFIDGKRGRLFRVDLRNGAIKALSPAHQSVSQIALDQDQLLLCVKSVDTIRTEQDALIQLDLRSARSSTLVEQGTMRIRQIGWVKGKAVFFGSFNQRYGTTENPKLYEVDENGLRCLFDTEEHYGASCVMSDMQYGSGRQALINDEGVLAVHTCRYQDEIVRLKDGQSTTLVSWPGSIQAIAAAGERIWLIAMKEQQLQELYVKQGEEPVRQLTHFNSELMAGTTVAHPQHFVLNRPDHQVDGWILKPADFDEHRRYPAILNIHGGPKAAYGEVFFHEMQYWAAQGYVVFYGNPWGSDGKGDRFADLRGRYGTVDYQDLMALTDYVLQQVPQIDPQRLGVTGGSYGGYMTNWIIGHTDRFAAAASQRSIANWVTMIGTDDCGFTFDTDQMAADPWSDVRKIWDQSPLQFADRVKTPTLFIHSFEDYSCPLQEGLQMANALLHHGVEVRMCLFHGESHGLSRIGKRHHRLRRLKEITEWMDRWLKQEER